MTSAWRRPGRTGRLWWLVPVAAALIATGGFFAAAAPDWAHHGALPRGISVRANQPAVSPKPSQSAGGPRTGRRKGHHHKQQHHRPVPLPVSPPSPTPVQVVSPRQRVVTPAPRHIHRDDNKSGSDDGSDDGRGDDSGDDGQGGHDN